MATPLTYPMDKSLLLQLESLVIDERAYIYGLLEKMKADDWSASPPSPSSTLFSANVAPSPESVDSYAYVGYEFQSGRRVKVARGFANLENNVMGVYEIPVLDDDHPLVWTADKHTEKSTTSVYSPTGPLLVSYGESEMDAEVYVQNGTPDLLLCAKPTFGEVKTSPHILLARSRPILPHVAERIKRVLKSQMSKE